MIKFLGKELEKPIIASSCIATESVENVLRLAKNGVQGAILKACAGGGVTNAEDVQKLLSAGAVTVQSATFLTKSPDKVSELCQGIFS